MSRTFTIKIETNDKRPHHRMEQFHAGTLTATAASTGYKGGADSPLRITETFAMGLISRFLEDHRSANVPKKTDPARAWWMPYFSTIEEVKPGVWDFVLEQEWLD